MATPSEILRKSKASQGSTERNHTDKEGKDKRDEKDTSKPKRNALIDFIAKSKKAAVK